MADDLFSQFFEMFNQPGPVNLRLAAEVARHLAGEPEPVDPRAAEEYRELTRLAEFRIEQVAPFPLSPAPDVLPMDGRSWAERNLEGFAYLAEPFGGMVDLGTGGTAELLRPLAPVMVGMQLGTLVGSLAGWAMASFDTGVPVGGEGAVTGGGPISYVVPVIDRFTTTHEFDPREVRLWVALNETSHRAIFRVPSVFDHLSSLIGSYAATVRIKPDRLMEMLEGFDPSQFQAGEFQTGLDPDRIADLFDTPEVRQTGADLNAFLGLTAGYRRRLVDGAAAELLPRLTDFDTTRDTERDLGAGATGSALAATFVDAESIARGGDFCHEVERRYGGEALGEMWTRPGRLPTAAEIADPVAWAARVLLDNLD